MPENEPTPAPQEPQDEVLLPSMPGGQPYDERGVDITLIEWMLSLTPDERLEYITSAANALAELRDGIEEV
jgi:hypothetical protein